MAFKLALYDLGSEFQSLAYDEVAILPTFKYRFHLNDNSKALKIFKDAGAIARAQAIVAASAELPNVDAELLEPFSRVAAVGAGEAVLFAVAAADASACVITGDKRAVEALGTTTELQHIAQSLKGRVKCLEQTVAEILLQGNATNVINKIHDRPWNVALRLSVSGRDPSDAAAALRSYYNDLAQRCDDLLAPFPEST